MAPKKVETVAVQSEAPEQPPSLDSDGYMDDLLRKVKSSNVVAVEQAVAHALGLEQRRINLADGITVDYHVELICFAAEHGYNAKKTLAVIALANQLRSSIESHRGETAAARELLKQFMMSQAEKSLRELLPVVESSAADGAGAAGDAAGSPASSPAPAAAAAAKAPPPKPAAKGAKGGAPPPPPVETAPAVLSPRAGLLDSPILRPPEIGPLTMFFLRGLFQHAHLYCMVHHCARPTAPQSVSFTVGVETINKAPPLQKAMTSAEVDQLHKSQEAKAEAELAAMQAAELQSLEEQRLAAEEAQRRREELAAEEKANQLYFKKMGTTEAVDKVQQEVEDAVAQRQKDILLRIAKLEQNLAAMYK